MYPEKHWRDEKYFTDNDDVVLIIVSDQMTRRCRWMWTCPVNFLDTENIWTEKNSAKSARKSGFNDVCCWIFPEHPRRLEQRELKKDAKVLK